MTHEEKNLFISNIFKLIIGGILLSTCFSYLRENPAEKVALYSSYKMIFQKWEVLIHDILWGDGELLSQKFELENRYLDLIHLAEAKGCSDSKFLRELNQAYEQLRAEKKKHIENYIGRYRIWWSDFQNQIDAESC